MIVMMSQLLSAAIMIALGSQVTEGHWPLMMTGLNNFLLRILDPISYSDPDITQRSLCLGSAPSVTAQSSPDPRFHVSKVNPFHSHSLATHRITSFMVPCKYPSMSG